jgi:predicted nuclease of predicted toxin-antitoxin system
VIVTADLDYPRLLALAGSDSPAIILFRGGSYSESEMLSLLSSVLKTVDWKELASSIVVVDRHRIRRRPLPLK